MRRAIVAFSVIASALSGLSACGRASAPVAAPAQIASQLAGPLPSWIASVAPQGAAGPNAQVRILFRGDLVPSESLEAPEHQEVLSHLRMEPALPGRFVLSTPRMIVFIADAPAPQATRVRVTLTRGLADVQGRVLDRDYAWTFQTDPLVLTTNLPDERHEQNVVQGPLKPEIVVFADAEANEASLLAHAHLIDASDPSAVLSLSLKAQTTLSSSSGGHSYTLTPTQTLEEGRRYRFEIEAGVLPAHGNMPSADRLVGFFDTFGPLGLQGVTAYGKPGRDGAPGLFAGGAPQLLFTGGLVAQSAEKAFSIDPPPPAGVPLVHIKDGDTSVVLNPRAFAPRKEYTIRISGDLQGVFGQTLGAPITRAFHPGDLAGSISAPSGLALFSSANAPALRIVAVNLLEGEYRVAYRVLKPEDVVAADLTEDAGLEKALPPQNEWSTVAAALGNNIPEIQRIPLRERLGDGPGLLAYGVAAKTNEIIGDTGGADIVQARIFGAGEVTNIGVFAQWFPDMELVRTQRLSDGMPIAGARITIYSSGACAGGTTDADGLLELRGSAFARCAAGRGVPHLLVMARKDADWAFVRTDERSDAAPYGVPTGWSAGVPQARGIVVSDRDTYRPGDTASLTGIAYFDVDGNVRKGRASSYRLTLEGPGGFKRDLGSVSLDAFGAFMRAVSLEKRLQIGSYAVHAHAENGEDISGTFLAAATPAPRFAVASQGASAMSIAHPTDVPTGGDRAFALALDKAIYRPGETARVLVRSPYPQAELLLTVVRHGVMLKKTLLIKGSASQIAFSVTPDMLPNAAVEAVLVRRNVASVHGASLNASDATRIGFAPFDVALDAQYLKTTLTPQRESVEPGGAQSVRVHVTDGQGRGVRAELVLAVSDDAVFPSSRFPDMAKIVYAREPISTRFADNRGTEPLSSAAPPAEGSATGEYAAGAALNPITFYDATLITDASGNATAHFRLPDVSRRWRVTTTAFTQDARFGNAEATFVSTKPLTVRAALPQFVRPEDLFLGGVEVTDTQKTPGDVGISGVLGGDVLFVDKDDHRTPISTFSGPMQQPSRTFRFPMRATGSKTGSVQFTTLLGNARDAFSASLDIRSNDVMENTVETGVTNEQATIPLTVDPQTSNDLGGLDVTLASTLWPDIQEAVRATSTDDAPLATAIASRIAVAADALVLDRQYKQRTDMPALEATLAENIDALRALQNEDGGYASGLGVATSDIASAAFCAISLARARAAGAHVDAEIARVRLFLLSRLDDPSRESGGDREPLRSEIRLEALTALSALGETRSDHLSDLYAQRNAFSFYERAALARYLLSAPARRAQGTLLRDALLEEMRLNGGVLAAKRPGSPWETVAGGSAQWVRLLIDSHARAEEAERAFRALLDLRVNGVWGCPSDTAQAMDAVLAYAAFAPASPDFKATIELTPGNVPRMQAGGEGNAVFTRHIPLAEIARGASAATVRKTGGAALHYLIAYRHAALEARPGAYGGVRLERIVRSAGDEKEAARFGLSLPNGAPVLDAGRIFDVEDFIATDHPVDDLFINDPLPAGLEAEEAGSQDAGIDGRQIYPDRVIGFARHLEPGIYTMHYVARAETPGTFAWPAALAHPLYAPEDFGRTAAGTVIIR